MSEIIITTENFDAEVLQSEKTVLIDFWATWCGPCRMQGPILSEFADAHPEIKVGKVNVDEQPELAMRYQVMSIPTLAVFKGGKPVSVEVGVQSADALEKMTR